MFINIDPDDECPEVEKGTGGELLCGVTSTVCRAPDHHGCRLYQDRYYAQAPILVTNDDTVEVNDP